jgi:hypothetical protein
MIDSIMEREIHLRLALKKFLSSKRDVTDYESLLLSSAKILRPGKNKLEYETIHNIISEVLSQFNENL